VCRYDIGTQYKPRGLQGIAFTLALSQPLWETYGGLQACGMCIRVVGACNT
jgi:hypothetical protein